MKHLFLGTTVTILAAIWAASGTAYADNPDQSFNFECSGCEKTTTVDHGKTTLNITCYGREANPDVEDWYVVCNSPEVGIHCGWYREHSTCRCSSDTPKAHTVKMTIKKCSQ